jgi:hypothetical protein
MWHFAASSGCSRRSAPIHNLAGLSSRFTGVNLLLVREITEDLYTASEHELVPGVVQSFKIVTEAASLRFFRFAFELARAAGRKSVHCIHKANILKMADGLFLDCFRRVAKDYPDITPKDLIVDNTCMQLVSKPQQFEVLAAGNLYGDLLSDLGAGLVGGVSTTAAINHGDKVKVYEAVYGGTHEASPARHSQPTAAHPPGWSRCSKTWVKRPRQGGFSRLWKPSSSLAPSAPGTSADQQARPSLPRRSLSGSEGKNAERGAGNAERKRRTTLVDRRVPRSEFFSFVPSSAFRVPRSE